jgi:hypothetical protein
MNMNPPLSSSKFRFVSLPPPLVRRCNGTTARLGYWKVGLEWPYNTPRGQCFCDSTIKLENVDGLND